MDSKRLAFSIVKGGGLLILAWYLLLLYRFPLNWPYRMEEEALDFYVPITLIAFLAVTGGLLRFAVRLVRLTSHFGVLQDQMEQTEARFFAAIEEHYLFHIQLLALLTVLVMWLWWLNGTSIEGEAWMLLLLFLAPGIVIAYLMFSLLTSTTSDLVNPGWSPGAWIAACVFAGSLIYLAENIGAVAAQTKQLFVVLWYAFRSEPSPLEVDVPLIQDVVAGGSYLIILVSSGMATFNRLRRLARDISSLVGWVKSKLLAGGAR